MLNLMKKTPKPKVNNIILSFGKFKGKTLQEIKEVEKSYLEWLLRSDWTNYKLHINIEKILGLIDEKIDDTQHVLNLLEKKISEHAEKYPTFNAKRLKDWLWSKPWPFKYDACRLSVSELNEKRRKSEKFKQWMGSSS